jgi:hypothetical protein
LKCACIATGTTMNSTVHAAATLVIDLIVSLLFSGRAQMI